MTWTLIKEILSVTADVVTVLGIPSLVYGIFKSLRSRKAKLELQMVKADFRFQQIKLVNYGAGDARNIQVHFLHGIEPEFVNRDYLRSGEESQMSVATIKEHRQNALLAKLEISWWDGLGHHIKKQDLIIN